MINLCQNTFFEFTGSGGVSRPGPAQISVRLQVQNGTDVLRNPTIVLIRKFPGPFGHPLTDWPGFFS